MDIMFEFLVQEGEIVEAKSPSKLFISVEQIPKINNQTKVLEGEILQERPFRIRIRSD